MFRGQAAPLWGPAISKGHLCPSSGSAVSTASSSAELTSKFTSNPLLFPGSFPISQLSTSELAAQHAAKAGEERTVPPQGFSQALLRHFWPEGLPAGSVFPTPIPGECFSLLLSCLSLPMSWDPALAGRSWHLAPSLLAGASIPAGCPEAHFPSCHDCASFCFKISPVNVLWGGRGDAAWGGLLFEVALLTEGFGLFSGLSRADTGFSLHEAVGCPPAWICPDLFVGKQEPSLAGSGLDRSPSWDSSRGCVGEQSCPSHISNVTVSLRATEDGELVSTALCLTQQSTTSFFWHKAWSSTGRSSGSPSTGTAHLRCTMLGTCLAPFAAALPRKVPKHIPSEVGLSLATGAV